MPTGSSRRFWRTRSSPSSSPSAIGFVIGRVQIGSFRLGNVVGTLLAGVLVGQLDVKVDPQVKTVFFALFLLATG